MRYFILFLFITLFLAAPERIYGAEKENQREQEVYDDIQYDEIQGVLDDILGSGEEFSFGSYVKNIISGKEAFSFSSFFSQLGQVIVKEMVDNKTILVRLISIAIIAAVFTNFAHVFQNNQVAETGFYVTYLLLFSILTTSFYVVSTLATDTLSKLLDFMRVLVPTYFVTVAFASGTQSAMVFYQSTLCIITLAEFILTKVLLPMINVYFILVLANNLSKEDMISKLTELLETMIRWTLKTLLGAVIGFHGIQTMVVPLADHVKNSVLMKAAGAIPGVGNTLGTVTETVFGAGVLVKNAVGAAGLIAIILICAIPLAKLTIYAIIYKFGVAMVQPISDKRIINCINASAKATGLLLYTVSIGAILFLFSIAIISATTNFHL